MQRYNPKVIESKWQKIWQDTGIYKTPENPGEDKYYCLVMFPYPSGNVHVGHWYNFGPGDTVARFKRMLGKQVLHPIGFDAFGLPAENAAITRKIQPAKWTKSNIEAMSQQLKQIGTMYDWQRTVVTSDPDYYRWTQWIFLKLYEHKLAERKTAFVNWCPKDKTVLANEQVIGENNVCERCETPVVQKELEQWFFKITDYADQLLDDMSELDWPERVKTMQANWIGKSSGAEIDFVVDGTKQPITVFTTRADTIFGATFLVLAPEHPAVESITSPEQRQAVIAYQAETAKKSELDRQSDTQKTGVFTGAYAVNPASGQQVPVWIADYVLMSYGTGAIMAVPAHDERDYEFAAKFDLPVVNTIQPVTFDKDNPPIDGKSNTKRDVVICIITNTKGQFLTLKWKSQDWHNFVMGGVESGEDVIDAAKREIAEETGYVDVEYTGRMPFALNSIFYAAHKDVNRDITVDVLSFKLKSDKQADTKRDQHEDFSPLWVERSELEGLHPVGGLEYIIRWIDKGDYVYTGEGTMTNAGQYDGLSSAEMRDRIIKDLAKKHQAREKVNYKIRDWLISRQRYWGPPIPIVYCPDCGTVPVGYDDLPVVLPEDVEFEPTGRSPLSDIEEFVQTSCPKCGKPAKRETDTMDTFVDSSWYFLRYPNTKYQAGPFDPQAVESWLPVDHYIGGIEHAILHLLYARFITKVLRDYAGLKFSEPFKRLSNQGIILGPDGNKMSKSKGNVVDPDEQVQSYGADSLRLYLMFMGPYDQGGPYDLSGITGTRRFIERVWNLCDEWQTASRQPADSVAGNQAELETNLLASVNRTVKKVTDDLEKLNFNTAVAALMELVNTMNELKSQLPLNSSGDAWRQSLSTLITMLAPMAPHVSEELWQELGGETSVHNQSWPAWDDQLIAQELLTIVVQVDGKVRANLSVAPDLSMADITKQAETHPNVQNYLQDVAVKQVVTVPGRLVNFVTR